MSKKRKFQLFTTDASFSPDEKVAYISVCNLTDGFCQSKHIKCKTSVQAEIEAIRLALKILKNNYSNSRCLILNDSIHAVNHIRKELTMESLWQVAYIPRELNYLADYLTKGKEVMCLKTNLETDEKLRRAIKTLNATESKLIEHKRVVSQHLNELSIFLKNI